MLAIHNGKRGFHPWWRAYCTQEGIEYRTVNCYANDIIDQLDGCKALLWHHNQGEPRDIVIAKQIMFALQHGGLVTFPDFRTGWHFDDKVAQKYLLEKIGAPIVPSYVFYDRQSALTWVKSTSFPKVWKLRGGAGSAQVRLVRDRRTAIRYVKKSFGKGFTTYAPWDNLKERWRKYRQGKTTALSLVKGVVRFVRPPLYAVVAGRQRGYVYFQEFVPNNEFDIRIVVIDNKAFGIKRFVRENDFRASGSGYFVYDPGAFDPATISLAFQLSEHLGTQCTAYDFVYDEANNPLVVEISYGYTPDAYRDCPGYWDRDLTWQAGEFNPQGWMVDLVMQQVISPIP